ncbi:MAG: monofunctional biosynthetic peptidoglycan transglycosylase [Muribaculaceae bacterium]
MIIGRILRWVRNILLLALVSSVLAVLVLKFVPVYYTPLMFVRVLEQVGDGRSIKLNHDWVSIDDISPNMVQAVVASEDNLFMQHSGFDIKQIKIARKDAEKGRRVRGASTISQQTAKNIFLWQGKSYIRKGLEAYFTVLIELVWGKERIMEVYLNSIEMGDGIYGVEAVAQSHFDKSARNLSRREAALIAATLPNPIKFNSQNPSNYMRKRQRQIVSLMGKIGPVNLEK